jgi:diguanylate cyclase (GGDEF)-like protein/PAS domain S-box-containing protein
VLGVYEIIVRQHDPWLVLLSVPIALFGAYTTVRLLVHGAMRPAGRARLWLAAASLAAGSSMWATHFVDLLSFRVAGPVCYDIGPTILTLLAAVVISGAGLSLALHGPQRWLHVAGGAVLGLGIAVTHYLGMSAAPLHGFLTWDLLMVRASVLAGCALSAAAVLVALGYSSIRGTLAATALFALAIGVVHATGIAAAVFHPGDGPLLQPNQISPAMLAANVAFVCCVVMGLSLTALHLDRRDAARREIEKATLRVLADIAVEGLVVCDAGRVVAVNKSFEQMCGRADSALRGTDVDALFDASAASVGMAMLLEKAGGERVLIAANGERVPVEVMRKAILYEGRPHEVVALRDLRERRKAEAEIRFLAHHDPLTGLSNRTAFATALERQLREQARDQTCFALLGIDLDRFKAVNDTLGHPFGDTLLRRVATRLRAAVRDADVVARIGGDEFSILLAGPMTPANAAMLARRVVEMIRRPFLIDGEVVSIGASVGVALAPQNGGECVALMKSADLALYRAKTEGGNGVRFFESGIDRLVQQRRAVEHDLRRALPENQLSVHYQPVFDLRSQSVPGFEALVRWRHPQRGLLLPGEFIPVAEETGLIVPIGARVLTLAARQAASWGDGVSIAVNLSAVQFADGKLVDTVRTALRISGLAPHLLELEITESVLLRDSDATLAVLHDLRDLGVRIAMDDFGTGYSSLRYLRSFPFDKIKIDRSFVQEMLSNEESATIVAAVIGIGRRLGITTIAEGVETEAQMTRLREEGCDMVQGFLIGRPEPAPGAGRHLTTTTVSTRELQADAVRNRQTHA